MPPARSPPCYRPLRPNARLTCSRLCPTALPQVASCPPIHALQCLNYTNLMPSQRNAFSLDCATDQGANRDCPVGKAWDPENPT